MQVGDTRDGSRHCQLCLSVFPVNVHITTCRTCLPTCSGDAETWKPHSPGLTAQQRVIMALWAERCGGSGMRQSRRWSKLLRHYHVLCCLERGKRLIEKDTGYFDHIEAKRERAVTRERPEEAGKRHRPRPEETGAADLPPSWRGKDGADAQMGYRRDPRPAPPEGRHTITSPRQQQHLAGDANTPATRIHPAGEE